VHQIPVWNDNCVYLAHEAETGSTAVIDPAVTGPVDNRCAFGRSAEARPFGIPARGFLVLRRTKGMVARWLPPAAAPIYTHKYISDYTHKHISAGFFAVFI